MVMEVRQRQVLDAQEEMENYLLEQLGEEDPFTEEAAELTCGMILLEASGMSHSEIYRLPLEEVLKRYHKFLQEDTA